MLADAANTAFDGIHRDTVTADELRRIWHSLADIKPPTRCIHLKRNPVQVCFFFQTCKTY
uniref:Reverse transcriptase domain-containing protein n=1 Tax=Ascaris lumbricoides TaxID=6252 RepID=A0A0M3HHD6_ASCLU